MYNLKENNKCVDKCKVIMSHVLASSLLWDENVKTASATTSRTTVGNGIQLLQCILYPCNIKTKSKLKPLFLLEVTTCLYLSVP